MLFYKYIYNNNPNRTKNDNYTKTGNNKNV